MIRVLIAGDYCPVLRVVNQFEKGDFESVLGDIKPYTEIADYSIVNLECPVLYGGEKPIEKCGPNLFCSEQGLAALKWVGFNCVTLANNHFYDYGEEGVDNTLKACRRLSIDYVGGGHNMVEASDILYKKINDQTIAIINCCEHEFSIATKTTGGSNPLNPIKQYYAIKEANSKADYVVVVVHGGQEHLQLPLPRMVETYRFFIDSGADVVVNHHQHCYSGYEVYQEKPIFYGLGNFCFDDKIERNKAWNEGYMVMLDFEGESVSYTIIPYNQCNENPCVKVHDPNIYNDKINELNRTINDNDRLHGVINDYYKEVGILCENLFEPLQNHFFIAAKHRGLLPSLVNKKRVLSIKNNIFCESHLDKLKWWLEQYLKKH